MVIVKLTNLGSKTVTKLANTFKGKNAIINSCVNPLANLAQGLSAVDEAILSGIKTIPKNRDFASISDIVIKNIQKNLKSTYGISAEFSNKRMAEMFMNSVEDFCNINKSKKLFKGLIIKSEHLDDISKYKYSFPNDIKDKSFEYILSLNSNLNWNNIEELAIDLYHKGIIPSPNAKTLINKELGKFLLFKHNRNVFHINNDRFFCNISEINAKKIGSSTAINETIGNYIAGRMAGKHYTPEIDCLYKENISGLKLKFPKAKPQLFNFGSTQNFKSINMAQKYLTSKYGINAEFLSLTQANEFAAAVDDLSKLAKSKKLFNGLKVKIGNCGEGHQFNNIMTKAIVHTNANTGEAVMYLNPAYNWKKAPALMKKDYLANYHPTPNPKDNYIHELVHYLDFKGNPQNYVYTSNIFKSNLRVFSDAGRTRISKVSRYAIEEPAEFNAEYVCGRMAGLKYPKETNDTFKEYYNGIPLKF